MQGGPCAQHLRAVGAMVIMLDWIGYIHTHIKSGGQKADIYCCNENSKSPEKPISREESVLDPKPSIKKAESPCGRTTTQITKYIE